MKTSRFEPVSRYQIRATKRLMKKIDLDVFVLEVDANLELMRKHMLELKRSDPPVMSMDEVLKHSMANARSLRWIRECDVTHGDPHTPTTD